mmetsp:Transcript_45068/g.96192  ORF Transcript_45068/g.96192 Transcript_45068/m.96192 type:complete len:228 (-) Transcript_45068:352-1035(-)
MSRSPMRKLHVQPDEECAAQTATDAHCTKENELPDMVVPIAVESAELERHAGAQDSPPIVQASHHHTDNHCCHCGTNKDTPHDARVHVRGALFDSEEDSPNGRTEGRTDTSRCARSGKVPGLASTPEGASQGSEAALGMLRPNDGTAVDHGPLLPTRQPRRYTACDAYNLAEQCPHPQHSRLLDSVQVGLYFRDATARCCRFHITHQAGSHRSKDHADAGEHHPLHH